MKFILFFRRYNFPLTASLGNLSTEKHNFQKVNKGMSIFKIAR